jgi:hypothetical protein
VKTVLILLVALSAPAFAQDEQTPEPIREPTAQFPETAPPHEVLIHPHREQRDKYLWGTFGPPGILESGLGAALGQILDTPDEWGQTKTAFAKRFATEYTESAINATTKYVVARIRDEDPSFRRCECAGVHHRALHAIVSPVMAYRFDDGRMQFSIARIAGTATSGAVSGSTWKPSGQNAGTVLGHVGLDLLSTAGVDLLREFVFHHRNAN